MKKENNISLVILAAGSSTRFGRPKQLEKIGPNGETLLEYTLFDAYKMGIDHAVFILNKSVEHHFSENIIEAVKDKINCEICIQKTESLPDGFPVNPDRKKPWGTAHALWSAKKIDTGFLTGC